MRDPEGMTKAEYVARPRKRLKVDQPQRVAGLTREQWKTTPHVLARTLGIGGCGFCGADPWFSPGCYWTRADYLRAHPEK